jgi:hypothetical protein
MTLYRHDIGSCRALQLRVWDRQGRELRSFESDFSAPQGMYLVYDDGVHGLFPL